MFVWSSFFAALAVLLCVGVFFWGISVARRDVSIVDSLWSLMFLIAAGVYVLMATEITSRAMLVLALVALWAVRLSAYITWRNWGEGEDRRYQAIRVRNEPGFTWKSLYLVFWLQAAIAWVISAPLLFAVNASTPLGLFDLVGVALWSVGMVFEAVGDWQLARFKADPANRGKVLDSGLWRYTRHPNYFGNACIWWGLFAIALGAGAWALVAIVSPILMTFLLLRVSGVSLLEQDIGERRPAYSDYIRRTNAFVPGLPRASGNTLPGTQGAGS